MEPHDRPMWTLVRWSGYVAVTLILAFGALVFLTGRASALSTVSLEQRPSDPGELVADVVLEADSTGVVGISLGFRFDPLELAFVGLREVPFDGFAPLAPGPGAGAPAGEVWQFDQFTLGEALVGQTRTLGSVRFQVLSSTWSVVPGLFGPQDGAISDGGEIPVEFFGLELPEPSSTVLVGLGLLILARRRGVRG